MRLMITHLPTLIADFQAGGFTDASPTLREETVKSMIHLVPKVCTTINRRALDS
jgi:hypothetical protein